MQVAIVSSSRVMFGRIRAQLPEGVQVARLYAHEDMVARCQENNIHLLFYDMAEERVASSRIINLWRALVAIKDIALVGIVRESNPAFQLQAMRTGMMALLVEDESLDAEIGRICGIRKRELHPQDSDEVVIRTFGEAVVSIRGQTVSLTRTEYHILRMLVDRKGAFVSTQTLTQGVWGADALERKEDLYVYISRLRDKLEENPTHPQLIRSSRGFGYAFLGEVSVHHRFA